MIRRAEHQDEDEVFDLAKDFAASFEVQEASFRQSFHKLLAAPQTHFAVAEVEAHLVGYLLAFSHTTFYANGRVAWVEEIAVRAEHRRQGIGRALMENAEDWAKNEGCQLIALATRRAADFYEAVGYQASAAYYRKLI